MKSTAFSFRNFNLDTYKIIKLKDINLEIPKNKITVIYGAYNSGKSLFLQTFSRLYEEMYPEFKETGEIILDGKNLKEYDKKELRKKIIFTDTDYLNALQKFKIEELLSLFFEKRIIFENIAQEEIKRLETLNLFEELSIIYSKKINLMNSFVRLKLLIFLTMSSDAEYVIYDNFLDKADDDTIINLFNFIADNKEKKTYLVSTRNIRRFLPYADLLIFIKNGRILYNGDSGGYLNLNQS